jgi:hypothetical protein
VATVQAHGVVEGLLTLSVSLVTGIGEPSVRLEKNGGSEVLLRVPPVGWARGRAACAENALVETVQTFTLSLGLAVFLALFM